MAVFDSGKLSAHPTIAIGAWFVTVGRFQAPDMRRHAWETAFSTIPGTSIWERQPI